VPTALQPHNLTALASSLLLASALQLTSASAASAQATAPAQGAAAPKAAQAAETGKELRIERLLPADTVAVIAVDRWSDLEARARRTSLWGLWESKEVQDALAKLYKAQTGEAGDDASFDEALEEIGLTREKLVAPQGAVAVGLFLEMNEEIAQKQPQLLAVADFGSDADKAQEMFDAVLASMERKGAQIEERDVRGRRVKSIELPEEEEEGEEDEEDDDEMDGFGPLPDPTDLFEHMQTMHFCRDGERFAMSSSLVALEDALEVMDGKKGGGDVLESGADFQAALKQLGDAKQVWAVLLTAPIQPLIAQLGGGEAAMIAPLLGKLVGDIRGYSFGLGIDGKSGMAEQRIGILSPAGKVGLLSLLESKPRGTLPPHVGPDAVSYGRMNVRFAGLMPLVKDVVKSVPAPIGDQIEMQLEQFIPTLEKAFAEMGPELHVAATIVEPLTAESQHQSVAIRAANPDAVKPVLDLFSPMLGLAPQDFLGNTIWADELSPMAVGIGGGWVVAGDQRSVEGVLRAAGQKELASLTDDKGFRRAFSIIPDGDLVGWGWQNVVAEYRVGRLQAKAEMEELSEILGADAAAELSEDPISAALEAITPELIEKHLGPAAWWMQSLSDGFVYTYVLMSPE
jgi:hypothetical protein